MEEKVAAMVRGAHRPLAIWSPRIERRQKSNQICYNERALSLVNCMNQFQSFSPANMGYCKYSGDKKAHTVSFNGGPLVNKAKR